MRGENPPKPFSLCSSSSLHFKHFGVKLVQREVLKPLHFKHDCIVKFSSCQEDNTPYIHRIRRENQHPHTVLFDMPKCDLHTTVSPFAIAIEPSVMSQTTVCMCQTLKELYTLINSQGFLFYENYHKKIQWLINDNTSASERPVFEIGSQYDWYHKTPTLSSQVMCPHSKMERD